MCEPSGDHDGKPNWPLLVSASTRDDPSVATIASDPSVSWTAIEPVEAIGRPAEAEPAGAGLVGAPLACSLADAAAVGDTAADVVSGEGEGVGLAQPATRIARMTNQAMHRFDLIGQRYACTLPSDVRRRPSAAPGRAVAATWAGPRW